MGRLIDDWKKSQQQCTTEPLVEQPKDYTELTQFKTSLEVSCYRKGWLGLYDHLIQCMLWRTPPNLVKPILVMFYTDGEVEVRIEQIEVKIGEH